MTIEDLKKPLPIESIDFRVQSVNKGGYATILAYKDARVDMNRLDEVVGAAYWKREHFDNNRTCRVSIYNEKIKEWVSKEDVGTVSNAEAAKGLASDSFKRACFNWGIGRELYDYPIIKIKLPSNEFKVTPGNNGQKDRVNTTFDFKLKEWSWFSEFNGDGVLIFLSAKDEKGVARFSYGELKPSKKVMTDENFKECDSWTEANIKAVIKAYELTTEQRKTLDLKLNLK